MAKSGDDRVEVFFFPSGIRLFPSDKNGAPVDVAGLGASATFFLPGSTQPWFLRQLAVAPASAAHPEASLDLSIDLSSVPQSGVTVAFEVTGFPDKAGKAAEFTIPFQLPKPTPTDVQPAVAQTSPSPEYVYGPGYYGYRYYRYPGPQSAPTNTTAPTVYSYAHPASRGTRDWTTGREYQSGGLIDKPWLTPMMD